MASGRRSARATLDDRSLETNDEITLGVRDATIARQLENSFVQDIEHCVELDAAQWARRGLWDRCKDSFFHAFNELL